MNLKKISALLMISFVMIISAACQSSAKSTKADQKSTKTAEVKVNSYEYTLPEDSTTTLRDNELVLKVNLTITNKGDKALSLYNSDFTLYQDDAKVSDLKFYGSKDRLDLGSLNKGKSLSGALYFLVDKGKKYQFVYQDSIKKNSDSIEIELDGEKILDSAKKLDNPAKALSAYTDIIVFDKKNDQFSELTGDNQSDVVNKYHEMFVKDFKRSAGIYGNEVSDRDILSMYKRMQNTMKDKTKVETSVKTISDDEAKVVAQVTGIDASNLKDKLDKQRDEFYNGKIRSKEELYKKSLNMYASEFEKLPPVSSPAEYEVKMKRNGDGQWKIDLNDYNTEQYMSGFIKTR
ncbi:DUF4352 domain-containing protein [Bacillus altitudinis]|uniref:DUF4352 domain-containing protein n=1 Tax=Bacillus altitudinis TaxID=293387 RepID=UPI0012F448AF|nr:DUF4352 domain-containing protein [Bacillus altitudinis]MCY7687499.1 DUF4352 domain-containing protein [Bacillus altitudinis]MCY7702879.1 DUF4352 domain-containing protein [Bacillus altitudinis]MED1425130.1 DUF4352 domain-containing protein [Bacillus altitudinis]VXC39119.1 putative Uncharacterized lipoprotein YcdA [Bacillus altitudinis]